MGAAYRQPARRNEARQGDGPLLEALEIEGQRRETLRLELAGLERAAAVTLEEGELRLALRARVADLGGFLDSTVAQTRQILRKLLVGRLTCAPFTEGERHGYRFTGQGSYDRLVPDQLWRALWWPRRSSARSGRFRSERLRWHEDPVAMSPKEQKLSDPTQRSRPGPSRRRKLGPRGGSRAPDHLTARAADNGRQTDDAVVYDAPSPAGEPGFRVAGFSGATVDEARRRGWRCGRDTPDDARPL